MKKIIFLLSLVSAVSLFSAGEELVANGDFQKVRPNGHPEKWSIQKWHEPAAVNGASAAGKDGESDRALSLESSAVRGYIVAAQNLKLEPAKNYTYTFRCRSEKIQAEKAFDGGSVLIECDGKILSSYTVPRKDEAGWVECKRSFYTGKLQAGARCRVLLIMRNGTGKVFFDNFSLKDTTVSGK